MGADLITIHHIGSTSVPGLPAKHVIDMLPIVRDVERVESFNATLADLGYEALGENGIAGRRYFIKGGDLHRSHNVHVYAADNPEVQRHLDFRDYLRVSPAEAERYATLKQDVARAFPDDIYGYMDGKDALIKELLQKAQAWRAAQTERAS